MADCTRGRANLLEELPPLPDWGENQLAVVSAPGEAT